MTLTTWPELDAAPEPALAPAVGTVRLPSLDEVARRWAEIDPLLAKACHINDCYAPVDVLQAAFAGRCGIWLCEYKGDLLAVIATEIREYPRRRLLEMMFCGGRGMRLWLDAAITTFDAHARACGCSHVLCAGRPGWARAWRGRMTGDVVMVREVLNAT